MRAPRIVRAYASLGSSYVGRALAALADPIAIGITHRHGGPPERAGLPRLLADHVISVNAPPLSRDRLRLLFGVRAIGRELGLSRQQVRTLHAARGHDIERAG